MNVLSTEVYVIQEHHFVCSEKPFVLVKPAAAAAHVVAVTAAAAHVVFAAGPAIATADADVAAAVSTARGISPAYRPPRNAAVDSCTTAACFTVSRLHYILPGDMTRPVQGL